MGLASKHPFGRMLAIALAIAVVGLTPGVALANSGAEAEARRKAYEVEMLERARAEAEERRREMERQRAAAESRDGPAGHLSADEAKREEEARRLAERMKAARDLREAAAAAARTKAEQEARQKAAAEAARRAQAAHEQAARERAEREAREQAQREARERQLAEAEARQRAAEAREREAEEAQARARAEAQARLQAEAEAEAERQRVAAEQQARQRPSFAKDDTTVTILLVMEPGNRGIRRHNPTGDPILCKDGGCLVSAGSGEPARLLPGRQAFGLRATLGRRAGACRDQLGCVFRGVELGALPQYVQPMDLRLIRHDRRMPQQIDGHSRCRLDVGRIDCARAFSGPDYVMWVIPEWMADRAGPEALEAAVAGGLTSSGEADFAGRGGRYR